MSKIHLQTIDVEKDFLQGEITLPKPKKPKILGSSAIVYVTKTDNGVKISSPQNEEGAFINNFNINLIPTKNKLDENKFICNFNWDVIKNVSKYRLYKNNVIFKEVVNNCFKYNFEDEENGTYMFKIDCIQPKNYVQQSPNSLDYVYTSLNIPILFNYKYYFYYYIENKDTDTFANDMLTPLPIDNEAAYIFYNNKNKNIKLSDHAFLNGPTIAPIQTKGVLTSDDYIYFTENDYTKTKHAPSYILLLLNKTLGFQYQTIPVIKTIDIYIEKIEEDDESINEEIGGRWLNDY